MAGRQDIDAHCAQEHPPRRKVLIAGGGLAGLSAACELADQGYQVCLLEKRPYLGGRTFSFVDSATGVDIDNGQHIFMKCCVFYVDFLKKLGCYDKTMVQKNLSVPVVDEQGRVSVLAGSMLPAPIHLAPSFFRYRHLSPRDKLGVLRAAAAMRGIAPKRLWELDGTTFYEWLKDQRQSDRAIDNFWDLIVLPALNDRSRSVSAAQAIMILQTGLMQDRHAADIGLSRVGLSHLLANEARAYIEARGGELLLSQSAAVLDGNIEAIDCVRTQSGQVFTADAYVLAVPPDQLAGLLPPSLREHDFFLRAARLRMSPIVNLHLWLDRKVTDFPFATYLGSRIQWVFNKSTGDKTPQSLEANRELEGHIGQHLVISISGAHQYNGMPKEPLYRLLLEDLHRRIPISSEAQVLRHVLVREQFATFSPAPGSAAYRLPQQTPVPNLFLAGAWTETGWPATMEGAVRSGVFCARTILGRRIQAREAA